ncbi:hypothetical protein ACROYT_G000941 [Oculina patagonica]
MGWQPWCGVDGSSSNSSIAQERYTWIRLEGPGACWSCLRYGHRLRNCKKAKECGVSNCKKKHHVTLHESEVSSSSAPSNAAPTPAPSNACTSLPGDRCLLQLQRIRTPRGFFNVMWDNASSLSFITNNKAKAERLHGTPLELTLVKVGADEEKISSRKYQLPLIDVQEKRNPFTHIFLGDGVVPV